MKESQDPRYIISLQCESIQALRMVLQMGVKPSWFSSCNTTMAGVTSHIPENGLASVGDLRSYMIKSDHPDVGDSVVPELLLKVLEPYRKEGMPS